MKLGCVVEKVNILDVSSFGLFWPKFVNLRAKKCSEFKFFLLCYHIIRPMLIKLSTLVEQVTVQTQSGFWQILAKFAISRAQKRAKIQIFPYLPSVILLGLGLLNIVHWWNGSLSTVDQFFGSFVPNLLILGPYKRQKFCGWSYQTWYTDGIGHYQELLRFWPNSGQICKFQTPETC